MTSVGKKARGAKFGDIIDILMLCPEGEGILCNHDTKLHKL